MQLAGQFIKELNKVKKLEEKSEEKKSATRSRTKTKKKKINLQSIITQQGDH